MKFDATLLILRKLKCRCDRTGWLETIISSKSIIIRIKKTFSEGNELKLFEELGEDIKEKY